MVEILCTARREDDVAYLYAVGTTDSFTWISPSVKDRVKECNVLELQLENALYNFRFNGGPKIFCPTVYDWIEEFVRSIEHLEDFEDIEFTLPPPVPYPSRGGDVIY